MRGLVEPRAESGRHRDDCSGAQPCHTSYSERTTQTDSHKRRSKMRNHQREMIVIRMPAPAAALNYIF
jgi:hypothetical protein